MSLGFPSFRSPDSILKIKSIGSTVSQFVIIFNNKVLPLTDISRSFCIGGETINFSLTFLSSIYSLKVTTNLFPEKFFAPDAGSLFTTTGGRTSFGPPEGELIFAQAEININQKLQNMIV